MGIVISFGLFEGEGEGEGEGRTDCFMEDDELFTVVPFVLQLLFFERVDEGVDEGGGVDIDNDDAACLMEDVFVA